MGMDALATPATIQCISKMYIFRPQYQSFRLHLLNLNGGAWMLVYVRSQKANYGVKPISHIKAAKVFCLKKQ